MYKGYQFELFTNDWGINSGFKRLADELHGLLPLQGKVQFSQSKNKHLDKFRRGEIQLLVATDVIGRGIDIPNVQHVIIFEFAPHAISNCIRSEAYTVEGIGLPAYFFTF